MIWRIECLPPSCLVRMMMSVKGYLALALVWFGFNAGVLGCCNRSTTLKLYLHLGYSADSSPSHIPVSTLFATRERYTE